uniref:CD209 antigen-like protein E n=1 Tax=Styela clava TaxID=7725 RepID=UPI00193AC9DC|nr:CD209 antigen-like protein E [Styela clava]
MESKLRGNERNTNRNSLSYEGSNLNHSPNELENAENITKNFERFLKKHLEKKNREVLDAQFPVLKIAVVVLSIVAAMVTYHSMKIAKDFDRKFEELQNEHTVMRTKIEVDRENMKNSVQSGDDKLMKVIESQNEKILKLSGWFKASNNLFYKRFSEKVDYLTARKRCKQLGAQLISTGFRDPDVRREILPKICIAKTRIWIGLDDIQREEVFIWSDGTVLADIKSIPWRKGEPNNYKGMEDCGEYLCETSNSGANDGPCSPHLAYACEKAFSHEL